MKKIIVYLIFSGWIALGFGQETLLKISDISVGGEIAIKDTYSIVNDDGSYMVFLINKSWIYGYLFSKNSKYLGRLSLLLENKRLAKIIGHTQSENTYNLILRTKRKNEFGQVLANFKTKKIYERTLNLNLKKERLLQAYQVEDKCYILSIQKRKSILNLRLISPKDTSNLGVTTFNLDQEKIYNSAGQNVPLDYLITNEELNTSFPLLQKVDTSIPLTIDKAKSKNKIYAKEKELVITIDHSNDDTHYLSINTDKLTLSHKIFRTPRSTIEHGSPDTNSFLFKDFLFQLAISKNGMDLSITNTTTGEVIKKWSVSKEQIIPFKSTPFTYETKIYKTLFFKEKTTFQEFELTKDFLKSMSIDEIAMNINEDEHKNIKLRIGTSYYSFDNPQATRASRLRKVFVDCIFDGNFNKSQSSPIKDIVFNKFREYRNSLNDLKAEIFLKSNDTYVYGHHSKNERYFTITQFKE